MLFSTHSAFSVGFAYDRAVIASRIPRPGSPRINIRAVLHWSDGRIWDALLPDGPRAWHFRADGRSHCFNPSGDIDSNGAVIWVECPPTEHK